MQVKKGFSLIEMLIYASILAIVSIFVVNNILIITKSFRTYKITRDLNTAGEIAMERLTREIRLANSIDSASSVFDINPGYLKLNTINPDTETATTIEFYKSGGALVVKKASEIAVNLAPNNIELTNLVFRQVATSTNLHSKSIKIEIEIKEIKGNQQKTLKLNNTIVLRRSYE